MYHFLLFIYYESFWHGLGYSLSEAPAEADRFEWFLHLTMLKMRLKMRSWTSLGWRMLSRPSSWNCMFCFYTVEGAWFHSNVGGAVQPRLPLYAGYS